MRSFIQALQREGRGYRRHLTDVIRLCAALPQLYAVIVTHPFLEKGKWKKTAESQDPVNTQRHVPGIIQIE